MTLVDVPSDDGSETTSEIPAVAAENLTFGTGVFSVETVYLPIPVGLTHAEYKKLFGAQNIKVAAIISGTVCYETEATYEKLSQGKPVFWPWGAVGKAGRPKSFSHYARKHTVCVTAADEAP